VDPAIPSSRSATTGSHGRRDTRGLLAEDPYIQRAFQLLRLVRTMKREHEPAQGA